MKLLEAFVEINGKDNASKVIDQVGKNAKALSGHFKELASIGRTAFLGIAGYIAIAVKAFSDEESAAITLKAALTATGQETDNNAANLQTLAKAISGATTLSKAYIEEVEEVGIRLGLTADQTANATEAAVGLAEVMGTDAKAAMETYTKALGGNFRELQRLFPQLRNMRSDQEKLNFVIQKSQQGFQIAESRTKTFSGALLQMKNKVAESLETIGSKFAGQLGVAINFIDAISDKFSSLSDAQVDQVVKWVEIAAAVAAGAIAFGIAASVIESVGVVFGLLGNTIALVGNALFGVVKVFISLAAVIAGVVIDAIVAFGTAIIAVVTSPITLIIAAIAAVVTALAYLVGDGDKATDRIASGFNKMYVGIKSAIGFIIEEIKGLISWFKDVFKYFEAFEVNFSGKVAKAMTVASGLIHGKSFSEIKKDLAYLDEYQAKQDAELSKRAVSGGAVRTAGDALKQGAGMIGSAVGAVGGAVGSTASKTGQGAIGQDFNGLMGNIKGLLGSASNFGQGLADSLKSKLLQSGGLKGLLSGLASGALDAVGNQFAKLKDKLFNAVGMNTHSLKLSDFLGGPQGQNVKSATKPMQFANPDDLFTQLTGKALTGGGKDPQQETNDHLKDLVKIAQQTYQATLGNGFKFNFQAGSQYQ